MLGRFCPALAHGAKIEIGLHQAGARNAGGRLDPVGKDTLALETARNSLPSLNETRAQLLLDQHALTTAITRDITTLNTLPSAMNTLARERRNLVQQLRSAKFTY